MPKCRMHGGHAGHHRGSLGAARALRQAPAEKCEEVERAIHRHAQRDRRGHHAADIQGGAGPPQRTEQEDHRKHVGDHRHQPGHHSPLDRHHHQRDHATRREETREQVVQKRLLDRVDQRHHAGKVGPHAFRRAAVRRHDRLDAVADHLEKLAVVDASKRGGAGCHTPELNALDLADDPHVGKAGEVRLELTRDHRLAGRGERARRRLRLRHEQRRRHHARHPWQLPERRPHLPGHVEPLRRANARRLGKTQHHLHRHQRTDVLLQPAVVADHAGLRREQRVDRHRRADAGQADGRHRHGRGRHPDDHQAAADCQRGEPGRGTVGGRFLEEPPPDRPPREEPRNNEK